MDNNDPLIQLFKRPVLEYTRYMNFFYAKIESTEDELKKGRKLVTIPQLGWSTQDKGVWAWPTEIKGIKNLKVGDWVIVYFVTNDPNDCHIQGRALNIENQQPQAFDGNTKTDVLYQDNGNQIKIVYSEEQKEFTIADQNNTIKIKQDSGEISMNAQTLLKLLGGTEAFVKDTTSSSNFDNLITALQTHVHTVTVDPGSHSGTTAVPTNAGSMTNPLSLSTKIYGE